MQDYHGYDASTNTLLFTGMCVAVVDQAVPVVVVVAAIVVVVLLLMPGLLDTCLESHLYSITATSGLSECLAGTGDVSSVVWSEPKRLTQIGMFFEQCYA